MKTNTKIEEADPVLTRRSIRSYTLEPVSEDLLHRLLRAAMVAHSAGDERPWQFVIIREQLIRDLITHVHPFAPMAAAAPVSILICADKTMCRERCFWVQDCAAATENILIEAQYLGLGAAWLSVYPVKGWMEGFRRLLEIPDNIIPFSLVTMGHPDEQKDPIDLYDESRIHHDGW
jgi:nitroreductase